MIEHNNYILCWLATVDDDMLPNVSPKEMFLYDGSSNFYIANIASPNSEKNIQLNNKVCVCILDIFRQVGLQMKGVATVFKPKSTVYKKKVVDFHHKFGTRFNIKSIIHIDIDSTKEMVAPSYLFCPQTTSYDMIEDALKSYRIKDLIAAYNI